MVKRCRKYECEGGICCVRNQSDESVIMYQTYRKRYGSWSVQRNGGILIINTESILIKKVYLSARCLDVQMKDDSMILVIRS